MNPQVAYNLLISASNYSMVFCTEPGLHSFNVLDGLATDVLLENFGSVCTDDLASDVNLKRWQYMRELANWQPLPLNPNSVLEAE